MARRLSLPLKRLRAQERDRFFREGGTPTAWKGGRAQTFKDRRREASRKACRGSHHAEG